MGRASMSSVRVIGASLGALPETHNLLHCVSQSTAIMLSSRRQLTYPAERRRGVSRTFRDMRLVLRCRSQSTIAAEDDRTVT